MVNTEGVNDSAMLNPVGEKLQKEFVLKNRILPWPLIFSGENAGQILSNTLKANSRFITISQSYVY